MLGFSWSDVALTKVAQENANAAEYWEGEFNRVMRQWHECEPIWVADKKTIRDQKKQIEALEERIRVLEAKH